MKKIAFLPLLVLLLSLSSCSVVESIFKAGLYVGVFIVGIVIAVIGFIIFKFRR